MQADYRRGEEVTARFVALAEKSADVGAVVIARRAHGVTRFMRGGLPDSRHSLATAVALYDPDRDAALTFQYGLANPRVAALSFLGRSLHLCGHPEQARHRSAEAVALARATGHTNSLAFALIYGAAPQHHAAGDAAGLAVALREFNGLTEAQGLPMWRAYADVFEGWLMAQEGHASEGVTRVEAGLRDFAATASRFQHSQMLTVLAQALIADDRPAAALDALLGFVLRSDERYFEAELLRLRAACRLLLAGGSREEAETDLGAALDVARSQGARAWELRAASDLARLWAERGEWRRAHDLLGPVHGWFTEGLDTPDLRAAGELLDGLR